MSTNWYVVKVLPGKERLLSEQFNKDINLGKIKNILRFVCPTEKEYVAVKNKKVLREKVLYSGYLYFETQTKLNDEDLKVISSIPNIMGMLGDKTPILLSQRDVVRVLKDETLNEHIESKKIKFIKGERIKITDGPFESFEGVISEFKGEKILVEVKIFSRNTEIELTNSQIEKLL